MSAAVTEKKWALESYAKRRNNFWQEITIDKQNSYLSLVYPMLIIALDDMGNVDRVDLSGEAGEIEVLYCKDKIGIRITDKNGNISRIKMCFANGLGKTGLDYCTEVVDELKKFVPVIQHSAHTYSEGQLKTLSQVITDLVLHMNKWALESYIKWENNSWKEITIDKQSSYLSLVYPMLIIALDNMGNVDCVNMSGISGEIEVLYVKDNLGMWTTDKNGNISIIVVSFANAHDGNKTGSDYCNEVVDELKKFVPVSLIQSKRKTVIRQAIMVAAIHVCSYLFCYEIKNI